MNYQSHSNERIGHGFFDMVKAVFCAKDRYYIWFTFGGCTVCTVGGGWTHRDRRHLLHERCRVYRGGGGGVLINGERPCWTSTQGAILQLWSKMSSFSFDEKYAWISKFIFNLLFIFTTCWLLYRCILCRYLVSNVQLVCKLSTDHALLFGITKVLPYWWDIYWYWSCANAAHSRVRTVVIGAPPSERVSYL